LAVALPARLFGAQLLVVVGSEPEGVVVVATAGHLELEAAVELVLDALCADVAHEDAARHLGAFPCELDLARLAEHGRVEGLGAGHREYVPPAQLLVTAERAHVLCLVAALVDRARVDANDLAALVLDARCEQLVELGPRRWLAFGIDGA